MAQTEAHGHLLPGLESRLQLAFTRNRASLRAFKRLFGFDQRLLLARWTNTQSICRGTAERGLGLAAPHVELV